MQDFALTVDAAQQKQAVVATKTRDLLAAVRFPKAGANQVVFSKNLNQPRQIVYLDTLAQDVGEALALIRRAGHLPQKEAGSYFRLADVGEALDLIDQAGLLPRTKPDWYLRLQEFAGMA